MDEDQKKRVAIFLFGVISDFFVRDYMERDDRARLLRNKCARRWQISFSNSTRLSRSTILGWVRLYRQGGGKLEALYPWAEMTGAAAGPWTRAPPRPWSACAGNCPLRQ
ncbi:hypothetical protein DFAR_2710010 [Desulfarculales bacterium]